MLKYSSSNPTQETSFFLHTYTHFFARAHLCACVCVCVCVVHYTNIHTHYYHYMHGAAACTPISDNFFPLTRILDIICDRIWENPSCRDACTIILIIIFVTLVITLRNSYLLSYGEINLSSILYYVYRRRYGLTSLQ